MIFSKELLNKHRGRVTQKIATTQLNTNFTLSLQDFWKLHNQVFWIRKEAVPEGTPELYSLNYQRNEMDGEVEASLFIKYHKYLELKNIFE